jgi:NAD(P)-dependent dehydrogenase (short-subunit alcohol dehydrogenase family)
MKKTKGVIVLTGCDYGMGYDLAKILSSEGFIVAASYLAKNPFAKRANVRAFRCDLRREPDIRGFLRFTSGIIRKEGGLYALICNAGIAKGGPVENLPMRIFREVMEVNFFGTVALVSPLLPYLIEAKGRIIIHGSMAGRIALPFLAPYSSSKFALEGFSDSLRREMKPFGVQVSLLETAGVATPIWKKAKEMKPSDFPPAYGTSLRLFERNFIDEGMRGLDQRIAAERIAGIVRAKHMRPRYIIAKSVLASRLERRIPDRLFDFICIRLFGMNYGAGK